MVTEKRHLLYHLVDAISETEKIEYLHSGLYESEVPIKYSKLFIENAQNGEDQLWMRL